MSKSGNAFFKYAEIDEFTKLVIGRPGHGKNSLQKRVKTIQVAVIASLRSNPDNINTIN